MIWNVYHMPLCFAPQQNFELRFISVCRGPLFYGIHESKVGIVGLIWTASGSNQKR